MTELEKAVACGLACAIAWTVIARVFVRCGRVVRDWWRQSR